MREYEEKNVEAIIGRVYIAQEALRRIQPDNQLLNLVGVDDTCIHWKKEFENLYPEANNIHEKISKYISELESIVNK